MPSAIKFTRLYYNFVDKVRARGPMYAYKDRISFFEVNDEVPNTTTIFFVDGYFIHVEEEISHVKRMLDGDES